MTTEVIPAVVLHEVASGNDMDGTAPDGTPSEETLFRGRYQKWLAGTKGGLFPMPARIGFAIRVVYWNLPGATAVDIYAVDDDDVEYLLLGSTDASGSLIPSSAGYPLPPTWKIKVVGTTAAGLTADGRCAVVMGPAWFQELFDQAPLIGREALPPGRVTI